MQPQQPTNPTPAPNYDFILNPAPKPRPSKLGGDSSMAMRILVVVGGLFVLMIIVALFMQLLGGNGSFDKTAMLTVAQDQTELIRLSDRGKEDSVSQTNKNFAVTAGLTLTTDNTELTTYLSEHGYKISTKQLAVSRSTATDTQLDNAKSASNFDPTYATIMKNELENYQHDLTAAYNSTKSQTGKTTLQTRYNNANMLLTQLTGEAPN